MDQRTDIAKDVQTPKDSTMKSPPAFSTAARYLASLATSPAAEATPAQEAEKSQIIMKWLSSTVLRQTH